MDEAFQKIASELKDATGLIIAAGAGMGVDSGLPDFRGDQGFWRAYPLYERLGLSFVEAANPTQFEQDPNFAWGFYGHRLNLYRETTPHAGFRHLLKLGEVQALKLETFVVTSNVDGHFQRAGFNEMQIFEVHGSIHHSQCLKPCTHEIWENSCNVTVDEATMLAKNPPACKFCGGDSRPNILMFGDWSWLSGRSENQEARFQEFKRRHKKNKIVVIEIGAGTAVPTIRNLSTRLGLDGAFVARINPREPEITSPNIGLALGALEATYKINESLNE
ncbi:MAG: Sir2 family NAD-dependent protein deacetylase [SAR324 cluster bacterium]|nr:Sir2 family NAD-dependent protein deacetylase [SAR324 cluster bacterium]